MAIWQYTTELIPKAALLELKTPGVITLDDYDNCNFWKTYSYDIGYFNLLTAELKLGKSWSDEIVLYGDSNSTCVNFFLEDDKIVGVDVRIDFRFNYSEFLDSIIEFCYLREFLIVDGVIILELNAAFIKNHIENSEQFFTYKELF